MSLGPGGRFYLAQNADGRIGPRKIREERRVDIARAKQLYASRANVVGSRGQRFGELSFNTQTVLKRVGFANVRCETDNAAGLNGEHPDR